MPAPSAKLSVMVGDGYACIRIVGRATFTSGVDFKALVDDLRQKGANCFILDLSECVLMDSTFLGLLAGLGLRLSSGNGEPVRHGVRLFNPSPRIVELLETLGVLHLFDIAHGSLDPMQSAQATEHTPGNHSQVELTQTCMEAHETLMALSPANAAKFKDVAAYFAESLKKAKAE